MALVGGWLLDGESEPFVGLPDAPVESLDDNRTTATQLQPQRLPIGNGGDEGVGATARGQHILILSSQGTATDANRTQLENEARSLNTIAMEHTDRGYQPWFSVRYPSNGGIQLIFGEIDGRLGVDPSHPVADAVFRDTRRNVVLCERLLVAPPSWYALSKRMTLCWRLPELVCKDRALGLSRLADNLADDLSALCPLVMACRNARSAPNHNTACSVEHAVLWFGIG